MLKWSSILIFLCLLSCNAFSAALVLSPKSQTVSEACTLSVGAADLVDIIGIDIVLEWDPAVVYCRGARFAPGALPGFAVFLEHIDGLKGALEVVLLKQSIEGFTGGAEPFLTVTFSAIATGTTRVVIKKSVGSFDPVLIDGTGTAVDAAVDTATVVVGGGVPPSDIRAVKLHQNYPNPFNPGTTIRFDVPAPSPVTLRVYDVGGRLVRTLLRGERYERGSWVKEWNGADESGASVQSGVYICVVEASGKRSSMKLVVLR